MNQQEPSLLQKIKQRHSQDVSSAVAEMDQANAEAQMPNAGDTAMQQRNAHSQMFSQLPDQEVQAVQAGPEEQAAHVKMDKMLVEAIHGGKQSGRILKAIFGAQDVVHGIGTLAGDLVNKLREGNPGATDDVLGSIGERAVEELVELVELADPSKDISQSEMSEAYSIGLQQFMQTNPQQVDSDELRSFLANA
jgi:hypothetical protein